MKRLFLLQYFILISILTVAQSNNFNLEFSQKFETKLEGLYKSDIYNISHSNPFEFATLSAYTTNLTTDLGLSYRLFSNKKWSSWIQLKEDKITGSQQRTVFGLETIFNKFEKIQFQSDREISQLITFRILFLGEKNTSEIDKTETDKEVLNCDLPSNCDRDCWCPSGDCDSESTPSTTSVTHTIVHHSATNYTAGTDYKQVVYSYWDYHVNTHGWNDIGYNWLVDPNGILYEGRGDGIQGAHFSCMNGHTMGVCVIGNFETVVPTTETLTALENLLAWEMTDKGIDVLTSSYHAPSQLNLYHVSGHKDGNSSSVGCPSGTLCPGAHLYGELSTIRNDIAGFPCYATAADDELNLKNNTIFYPNPVKDILFIESKINTIKKIVIFNSMGLLLKTINNPKDKLLFSDFKSGIYYLKIIGNKSIETQKIIKE